MGSQHLSPDEMINLSESLTSNCQFGWPTSHHVMPDKDYMILRSRPPCTAVLYGESPKVLWRLLSECFLGTPRKCPGECSQECRETGTDPGSAPESAFPHSLTRKSSLGRTPLGQSQFPGHSGKHSLGALSGSPQKALRQALA